MPCLFGIEVGKYIYIMINETNKIRLEFEKALDLMNDAWHECILPTREVIVVFTIHQRIDSWKLKTVKREFCIFNRNLIDIEDHNRTKIPCTKQLWTHVCWRTVYFVFQYEPMFGYNLCCTKLHRLLLENCSGTSGNLFGVFCVLECR